MHGGKLTTVGIALETIGPTKVLLDTKSNCGRVRFGLIGLESSLRKIKPFNLVGLELVSPRSITASIIGYLIFLPIVLGWVTQFPGLASLDDLALLSATRLLR